MFPFHTWLPDAHTEAPTAGSVILAAILLKMGTYGFVRFSLPIFPDAVRNSQGRRTRWSSLSIIGIVYGALVTLVQKDMKRLVAYSSVSHLGFVMLGMFALNMAGVQGGDPADDQPRHLDRRALPARRHDLRAAPHAHDRGVRRPREADAGVRDALPDHGALLDGPAAPERLHRRVHDPPGRLRERSFWWAFFAAIGIVLGAAYLLWLYQRVFFGEVTNPANAEARRTSRCREQLTLAPARDPRLLDRPLSAADLRRHAPALREDRGDRGRRDDRSARRGREESAAGAGVAAPARARPEPSAVTFTTKLSDWILLAPELFLTARRAADARDLGVRRQGARGVSGLRRDALDRRSREPCSPGSAARPDRKTPILGGCFVVDNFPLFFKARAPASLLLAILASVRFVRPHPVSGRRVLRPAALRGRRHALHGLGRQPDHDLRRARDDGALLLRPGRLLQGRAQVDRGGHEVLHPRRVLLRRPALRPLARLRRGGEDGPAGAREATRHGGTLEPADARDPPDSGRACSSRSRPSRSTSGRRTSTKARRRPSPRSSRSAPRSRPTRSWRASSTSRFPSSTPTGGSWWRSSRPRR